MTPDPVVTGTLRLGLALLFAAAAHHKLRDRSGFRATLADYRLLPAALVPGAAMALGLGEALLAVALLVPATGKLAAAGAAVLLTLYAIAIGVNLARGRRHVACGCLGPAAEQPVHGGMLVRNAVLVAASVMAAFPAASRPWGGLDLGTVVAAASTLALLYLAIDGLLANGHRFAVEARS